jgi:hypothetical protein
VIRLNDAKGATPAAAGSPTIILSAQLKSKSHDATGRARLIAMATDMVRVPTAGWPNLGELVHALFSNSGDPRPKGRMARDLEFEVR